MDTNTISYCGKDILPEGCINSQIRKLLPNVWYQVEDNIIIKNISNKYAKVIALTYKDEYIASSTAIFKNN